VVDVGKLGELLDRWGVQDEAMLARGVGGISVCIIAPNAVPPDPTIPQRDGWQLWLVGLGYPTRSYPTLAEAVQHELDDRARIAEET
jgi:hypothetical protein